MNRRSHGSCRCCHSPLREPAADHTCPRCLHRMACPDRAPDGRVLPPARRKTCGRCRTWYWTTQAARRFCKDCEHLEAWAVTHSEPRTHCPPPALVTYYADRVARGLDLFSDPEGRRLWLLCQP
jgi:hypothetical protein